MSDRVQHRQLYREMPEMDCIADCTDCCGPVVLTKYEAQRLGVDGCITPTNEYGKCIFSIENRCSVYDKRPFLCRLFGTVEKLPCPYGVKPKRTLTQKQELGALQRYRALPHAENEEREIKRIIVAASY